METPSGENVRQSCIELSTNSVPRLGVFTQTIPDKSKVGESVSHVPLYLELNYKLPLNSCSLSIASNKALKFPLPKDFAPFLWMIS